MLLNFWFVGGNFFRKIIVWLSFGVVYYVYLSLEWFYREVIVEIIKINFYLWLILGVLFFILEIN